MYVNHRWNLPEQHRMAADGLSEQFILVKARKTQGSLANS